VTDESKTIRLCVLALVIIAAVRLLALGAYPLMDNTESRYAEIGRVMAERGDWITPTLTDGRPFWAKPPLSTWLTAASIKTFGASEFAARFPYFLLAGALLWLTFSLARTLMSRERAWLAVAVLSTCTLFFISAGAVMTDMAMVLGTTMAFVGFWRSERDRRWGVTAFFGAGLALLGKGPVGLVLLGLPILAWCTLRRDFRPLGRLPWLVGVPVLLLTAVPWYAVAEKKTPGFLDYFLVGEHVKRFLDPGWKGDLYGTAHVQPKGMIWLYGLAAALPWSVPALLGAWRLWCARLRPEISYLACWALTPLIFFTLAGNILYTYVLPGLPAVAILLALGLKNPPGAARIAVVTAVISGVLLAGALWALGAGKLRTPSDKALIRAAQPSESQPLHYLQPPPASAWFYAQGRGIRYGATPSPDAQMLVVDGVLPPALAAELAPVGRFGKKTLYRRRR
jgi:4-amino-4-deoxy-L-arabinose transferase-like glycosyltransferase